MAWKATGQPTARKQRDKWVVRVEGIDTVNRPAATAPDRHVRVAALGKRCGS